MKTAQGSLKQARVVQRWRGGEELELRKSPLYTQLKDKHAVFGSKAGWERANWFAPEGTEPKDIHSFQRGNWFDAVADECRAVRERAGIIDQTSFA